jgi:hypothetical protein
MLMLRIMKTVKKRDLTWVITAIRDIDQDLFASAAVSIS